MEKTEIQFKNFKPRDNVEEKSRELIQQELDDLSTDINFKVAIIDDGKNFHISAMAQNMEGMYNSESKFEKKHIWGFPRLWQIKALLDVVRDLTRQIRLSQKMKKLFRLKEPVEIED